MPTFGLIDANSYFCAVEQAFAPDLRHRPLVVLSNNDGCAIARTAEAKALGIKMGEPWHLFLKRPESRNVEWRSSNYALYGDMSRRIYDVLIERVPQVEPYSIDEMFLDLDGIPDVERICRDLQRDVRQIAKIPTCVGIGPTKTIAKLANKVAKKNPAMGGVCDLRDPDLRVRHYGRLPIDEVWGIGSQAGAKLAAAGIATIADFVRADPRLVRDMLTVTGARVQTELHGASCLPLALMPTPRKGIAVSRSFGHMVDDPLELREAICTFVARAAEKLRAEGLEAGQIGVFAHTNPHNGDPWYSAQRQTQIEPTADTGLLIGEASKLLRAVWHPRVRFFKAGVMMQDLAPARRQTMLFATHDRDKSAAAMKAMDSINARFGRETLRVASAASIPAWGTRRHNLSPRYTTREDEMLIARSF